MLRKSISLSFMTDTNEQIQEEEELELPEVAEGEEDTTDWKDLALKQQGINKRQKTKLDKLKAAKEEKEPEEPETPVKKEDKQSSEFDYGQKTFINQILKVDLTDDKQMEVVNEYISNGKSLDDLSANKHFKNDLKDIKDAQKVTDAVPSGNKRSVGTDKSVEGHWLKKYESGTPLNEVPKEVRTKVLNAKLAKDKNETMFGG